MRSRSRGVEAQRLVDLRDHGDGSSRDNRRCSGNVGVPGEDHLVAGACTGSGEGAHERAGARVDHHGVLDAEKFRGLFVELVDLTVVGVAEELLAAEHLGDGVDLLVADDARTRDSVGQGGLYGEGSSVYRELAGVLHYAVLLWGGYPLAAIICLAGRPIPVWGASLFPTRPP